MKVTVLGSWEYYLASLAQNILFKLKLYANLTVMQFIKKIGDHMVTRCVIAEFSEHTPKQYLRYNKQLISNFLELEITT